MATTRVERRGSGAASVATRAPSFTLDVKGSSTRTAPVASPGTASPGSASRPAPASRAPGVGPSTLARGAPIPARLGAPQQDAFSGTPKSDHPIPLHVLMVVAEGPRPALEMPSPARIQTARGRRPSLVRPTERKPPAPAARAARSAHADASVTFKAATTPVVVETTRPTSAWPRLNGAPPIGAPEIVVLGRSAPAVTRRLVGGPPQGRLGANPFSVKRPPSQARPVKVTTPPAPTPGTPSPTPASRPRPAALETRPLVAGPAPSTTSAALRETRPPRRPFWVTFLTGPGVVAVEVGRLTWPVGPPPQRPETRGAAPGQGLTQRGVRPPETMHGEDAPGVTRVTASRPAPSRRPEHQRPSPERKGAEDRPPLRAPVRWRARPSPPTNPSRPCVPGY